MESARRKWTPDLARLYGLHPWDMAALTVRELRLLAEHQAEVSTEQARLAAEWEAM
jgi:hypothetical protein